MEQAFWFGLLFFPILTRFVNSQNAAPASAPASSDAVINIPCVEEVDPETRRLGDSFHSLMTPSAEECCQECRQDSDCISWERQRASGLCRLNRNDPDVADGEDDYDSGFGKEKQARTRERSADKAAVRGVAGGRAVAIEVAAESDCPSEDGFRLGPSLSSTTARSEAECCQKCDDTVRCIAWNFLFARGMCRLLPALSGSIVRIPGWVTGTNVGRR